MFGYGAEKFVFLDYLPRVTPTPPQKKNIYIHDWEGEGSGVALGIDDLKIQFFLPHAQMLNSPDFMNILSVRKTVKKVII